MDPESVHAVMDQYYAMVREIVDEHRGRVVKFIGDGVMAVFGVPDTSEDDSLRALDAALAMHEEFEDLAFEVARDRDAVISLRVGVNTGEVIVSAGDDDVVGDAVNLAARLEHAATPGTVLVGEETWRLTRGVAVFEAVPPLAVAGKANLVNAYRLLSVEEAAPDPRTEFVGRSDELETLAAVFDDVAASGTARLAVVLGSPGVGKTRLASELQRSLGGRATALFARCAQEGAATLAPIADVVRVAAGVHETADAATVVETVDTLIPDDEHDRDRIVASAAAILGAGAIGTPEETFWTVRRVLELAARERPVVLIIDDLHRAEPMLLDLVDHLSEWMRAPVMLIGLARPELRDMRGSMVDGSRRAVIALEGLDRPATRQLACELLETDALPPRLLDRLPESTGGNPLFFRELLRMLVDDGILRCEDGLWHLSVAPEAIDVPPTIQSLLSARLDRLPSDEQLVLERASIIGKEFSRGALHELVTSSTGTSLDAVLENLRKKELVEPDGTSWIDEPVYRFHHVLVRDAAYRRVLRQTRAQLHEQLARWLETKVGVLIGEHEELIGYHFEQAYVHRRELGPLDAHDREIGRDAGARLGAAAEHALDRDDLASASSLASRSLACRADDDAERADALLVQCEALLARGEAGAAAVAVADLGQYANTSPRLAAWSACFRAQLATMTDSSRLHETERQVAEVAVELTALYDARGAAKAHTVHAATLARLGRFADVEAALDRALDGSSRSRRPAFGNGRAGCRTRRRSMGPQPGAPRGRTLPRRRAIAAHHRGIARGGSDVAVLPGRAGGISRTRRCRTPDGGSGTCHPRRARARARPPRSGDVRRDHRICQRRPRRGREPSAPGVRGDERARHRCRRGARRRVARARAAHAWVPRRSRPPRGGGGAAGRGRSPERDCVAGRPGRDSRHAGALRRCGGTRGRGRAHRGGYGCPRAPRGRVSRASRASAGPAAMRAAPRKRHWPPLGCTSARARPRSPSPRVRLPMRGTSSRARRLSMPTRASRPTAAPKRSTAGSVCSRLGTGWQ